MDSKIIQDLLALHFLEEEEGQPVLCQEEVNLALRIKPSSIEGCSEASSTEVFFPDNLHEKTDRTVNPTAAERLVMARKAVEYRRSARIPNPDSHTANLLRRWQRKWKRKWDLADDKDEDALWERQKQRFESRMRLWGPLLSKKSRENFEHWKAKYGLDNGRHYNELQAQEWGDERIREMTKARKERAEFLCRRESRMADPEGILWISMSFESACERQDDDFELLTEIWNEKWEVRMAERDVEFQEIIEAREAERSMRMEDLDGCYSALGSA